MNLRQYKSTKLSILIFVLFLVVVIGLVFMKQATWLPFSKTAHSIKLPAPAYRSNTSIEEALKQRRSVRTYKDEALTLEQISQLLWAAQGITSAPGLRTAPSAGGLYPLQVYLISGKVQGLAAGIYRYLPAEHALEMLASGDKRNELAAAAHEQNDVKNSAIDLIITGVYKKENEKYGNHGERFVHLEAGHAAQNVYLQAVSLGLGTVSIGVFDEVALQRILQLSGEEDPIYLMPVGKPAANQ